MLKRLGLILGASVALLVACESDWTKIESAEITKIDIEKVCGRSCWTESTITFKKDDVEFKLEESYTANVDLLSVGQVLDVYFDEDFRLKKYELPFKKTSEK